VGDQHDKTDDFEKLTLTRIFGLLAELTISQAIALIGAAFAVLAFVFGVGVKFDAWQTDSIMHRSKGLPNREMDRIWRRQIKSSRRSKFRYCYKNISNCNHVYT
jgi:hypothetical protein